MPDFFIGTDILEVSRMESILNSSNKERFTERIFTENEIDYCKTKANPAIHFAGRFSAKEAVKKAVLSSKLFSDISLKDIEIIRKENGEPQVIIHSSIPVKYQCKVSISHSDESAVAFAILITLS